MSGLEVNKILASIILAVLIVTLIGHFGDLVIDIENDDKKGAEEDIYTIEDIALKQLRNLVREYILRIV